MQSNISSLGPRLSCNSAWAISGNGCIYAEPPELSSSSALELPIPSDNLAVSSDAGNCAFLNLQKLLLIPLVVADIIQSISTQLILCRRRRWNQSTVVGRKVDHIFFTGGTDWQIVMGQQKNLTPVTLELGGRVLADSNINIEYTAKPLLGQIYQCRSNLHPDYLFSQQQDQASFVG